MAITQTGAIYKAFSFDNVSSRDYGVYITSEAVYNAPERDVEMISIPGRNGAYALDNGRFENIEVKYPAGIFADNETDFAQAVSDFRNYLCSKKGYVRLADEYNPDEYRMAVYKSGLEVSPVQAKAGEFEIIFECKPQRWLTVGETAIEVSDGDTLTNPTLFNSSPFLESDGYGHIQIGDYNISIEDIVVGRVDVSDKITVQNQDLVRTWNINEAQYNSGDHVTIDGLSLKTVFTITNSATFYDYEPSGDRTMGIEYYNTTDSDATLSYSKSGKTANFAVVVPPIVLTIGQSLTKKYSMRATINVQTNNDAASNRVYFSITFKYINGTLTISAEHLLFNEDRELSIANPRETCVIEMGSISGNSTLSILDGTVYIDCDLGDAYQIKNGQYVSLNAKVDLGSDLPKLESGTNVIAMDNTITNLKITPRWWKV